MKKRRCVNLDHRNITCQLESIMEPRDIKVGDKVIDLHVCHHDSALELEYKTLHNHIQTNFPCDRTRNVLHAGCIILAFEFMLQYVLFCQHSAAESSQMRPAIWEWGVRHPSSR